MFPPSPRSSSLPSLPPTSWFHACCSTSGYDHTLAQNICLAGTKPHQLYRSTFLASFSSSLPHSIYLSHLPFFFFSLLFLNNHLVHISEDTVQLTEGESPEKTYAPFNPLHLEGVKMASMVYQLAMKKQTNKNIESLNHIFLENVLFTIGNIILKCKTLSAFYSLY